MGSPTFSKLRDALFLSAIVWLVAVGPVAAEDPDSPDLGSGWELQLEQSLGEWSTVAGSADGGFVVRGLAGDGGPGTGIALWSADGSEWQEITDPVGTEGIFDMAANDRGFVAARSDRLPNRFALFSPDGQGWESVPVGASADFWRVESGPAGFLLVSGCDFVVVFSPDGRDWGPTDIPSECGSFRAAQTDNGWVAVTNRAGGVVVLSSSDGTRWSEVEAQAPLPPLPPASSWVGYGNSLQNVSLSSDGETLVLAGKGIGGGLWVSTDEGMTWTERTTASGEVEMAVGDIGFVGVAPRRVLASSDGTWWVEHRVELDFHDVAVVGNTVVATAADGIYAWTPPEGALADTGTELTPLLAGAFLLIGAGVILLTASRHLQSLRS